jgi:glycosidase
MTFWLEKGVDGFRVDTVNMWVLKDHSIQRGKLSNPDFQVFERLARRRRGRGPTRQMATSPSCILQWSPNA